MATCAGAPAWNLAALGRCELWWMKSFHGVCVLCSSVVLSTRGFSGSEMSNAAAPPEAVCQPTQAWSKSQ